MAEEESAARLASTTEREPGAPAVSHGERAPGSPPPSSGFPAAASTSADEATGLDSVDTATAAPQSGASSSALSGELSPAPRPAWLTALLAVTGLLLVRMLARVVGRYALGLARPARLTMTPKGLELTYRVELLGRTLREGHSVYPIENLVSVTREVRFARAGTYAGLVALVLGTYAGVSLLADGLRAPGGSPTLIGLGVGIVALGLALDFGLTTLLDSARRRVRLVITPRRGSTVAVAHLSEEATDALLRDVATAEPSSDAAGSATATAAADAPPPAKA